MTKAELADLISQEAEITKKAATAVLDAFVGAIHETLREHGRIRVADLGTFRVAKRKARNGVNPQTKETIRIPASKVPRFDAAKALKEAVRKPKKK